MMHDVPKHRFYDPVSAERELDRIYRDVDRCRRYRQALAVHGKSSPWFVIRVRGSEKSLAEEMAEIGVAVWFPQRKVIRRLPRKRAKYQGFQPVVPGYLFVSFEPSVEALVALGSFDGFDCVLGCDGKPWPLNDREINLLRELDQSAEPERHGLGMLFSKGETVEVVDGPFIGLEATVEGCEDKSGMVPVEFNILGRLTAVHIGIDVLRKLG